METAATAEMAAAGAGADLFRSENPSWNRRWPAQLLDARAISMFLWQQDHLLLILVCVCSQSVEVNAWTDSDTAPVEPIPVGLVTRVKENDAVRLRKEGKPCGERGGCMAGD